MINYFITSVPADDWGDGPNIFLALLALVIFVAAIFFLVWGITIERKKYLEEQRSYIEGVLSLSEIRSSINQLVAKTTFDTPFNVVLLDIDKYSQMVGAFGEKIAKDVIIHLANKFEKVIPFQVQMGRVADDKFIFLFKPEYDFKEVYHVAQQLKDIFKDPIKISYEIEVSLTTSVALASYPRHGRNFQQLMESLNIAIYTAKKNGGDRLVVYSDEMGQEEGQNVQYYEQVKRAIENKEFVLFYQPIVDTQEEKVFGAEALLRWEHSTLGLINPKEFINILESSGDIYWVGIWGLESLVEQYSNLKARFPYKEINLHINLSMKQLLNDHLVVDFMKILKKYKVSARNFVLELEEFIMYEKHDKIRNTILKLREIGFGIAVDGFSFDHKTLLKIENLPIDYIKLDSNFIQNENKEITKHLTNLLITFAKEHNITVIAERLEDLETIEYFKEHDIKLVQGYYISKPITSEEFVEFVGHEEKVKNLLHPQEEPTTDEVEEQAENEENQEENQEEIIENPTETPTEVKEPEENQK